MDKCPSGGNVQNQIKKTFSLVKYLAGLFLLLLAGLVGGNCDNASAVSSAVSVDVVNGIALRILDKTGSQEISGITFDLLPTVAGTFSSDNFLIDVSTSNKTGYKLYFSSSADSTSLIRREDEISTVPSTIPTLDSSVSKADFSKDNSAVVNHWGYSLDDATYLAIVPPGSEAEIESVTDPSSHNLTPFYIGIDVNMEKAAGDYTSQLVFSAIANPVPTDYSLSFFAGTDDEVSGIPDDITLSEVSAQHTFTIPSDVPTRTGYVFLSWKDETADVEYQLGDDYTIVGDEEFKGDATLTAQWKKQDTWETITEMQQMTSTICANAPSGETKTLIDSRDGQLYTVIKLAYASLGCWMKSNLALEGPITLTSDSSDTTTSFTLPAADTEIWCAEKTAACINKSLVHENDSKYYYNWYTATAGSGNFGTKAQATVSQSICPKGWKLPTKLQLDSLVRLYSDQTKLIEFLDLSSTGMYLFNSSSVWSHWHHSVWSRTLNYSNLPDYPSISYYPYTFQQSYGDYAVSGTNMYNGTTIRCRTE